MITSIILAAGIGKRMYSSTPKVLHKICGREMIFYSEDAVRNISEKVVLVISKSIPREIFKSGEILAYQDPPLGTGDAVKKGLEAVSALPGDSLILITTGDNPLIKEEDIVKLVDFHLNGNNQISLLSAISDNPSGLGRVIKDANNSFVKIVEEKDANDEEKLVKEINVGTYIFRKDVLEEALSEVGNNNTQKEYYLTDSLEIVKKKGMKIGVLTWNKVLPVYGINNRYELYEATRLIQQEILVSLMKNGVTVINPDTVVIDHGVKISNDVTINPGTMIEGSTKVESGCELGPYARVVNSVIGKNTIIQFSVVVNSLVGENCTIGPFAHVRPENILANNVKIGTFVEVKKSKFNEHSKAPHLSYIGDATIGKNVNIGAGTITCNFSGLEGDKKNPTFIEDDVFIGSNSTLVAPITIRKGSYTAAGSVITDEVPEESLAIGRAKQVNKEGWVKRRKKSNG
ncbi:MAG: bifunctional UDP-N-acetylglucosamine diphosphorylase/glucosamine-1-phosphate N-acetyltransferase GlmU [Fervidobacterium sp.]